MVGCAHVSRWLVAVGVVVLAAGCGGGEEGGVLSAEEQAAVEADDRVREAELAIRAMRPGERDYSELLALMASPWFEMSRDYYEDVWAEVYEVDGRLDVARRETVVHADGRVTVRTCEVDWANEVRVDGGYSGFRGGFGYSRPQNRTFALVDGRWIVVDEGDDDEICAGVPDRQAR